VSDFDTGIAGAAGSPVPPPTGYVAVRDPVVSEPVDEILALHLRIDQAQIAYGYLSQVVDRILAHLDPEGTSRTLNVDDLK
jgi:hypothetical protein